MTENPYQNFYKSQMKEMPPANKKRSMFQFLNRKERKVVVRSNAKVNSRSAVALEHCLLTTMFFRSNITNSNFTGAEDCEDLEDGKKQLVGFLLLFEMFKTYLLRSTDVADNQIDSDFDNKS